MTNIIAERDVGDTIRISSELFTTTAFSDSETLSDGDEVTITIKKKDGTKVVDSASYTKHDTGQYYYTWDTTGLEEADYKVIGKAVNGDAEEETDGFIRLRE